MPYSKVAQPYPHCRTKPFSPSGDELSAAQFELSAYLSDSSKFSVNDGWAYRNYVREHQEGIGSLFVDYGFFREVFGRRPPGPNGQHQHGYREWLDPEISEDLLRLLIADFVDDIDGISSPKQFSAQLFWCYRRVRRRLYRRLGLLPVPQLDADILDASFIDVTDRFDTPDLDRMQRRLGNQKPALPTTPAARLEHKSQRRPWPPRLPGK